MFILVHLKNTKKPIKVNMDNVAFIADGEIYFIGGVDNLHVLETIDEMCSQTPYDGVYS